METIEDHIGRMIIRLQDVAKAETENRNFDFK